MAEAQAELPLSGPDLTDENERAHWARIERDFRERAAPVSRIVGHKSIAWATGLSGGQVSKELSGLEDKHLSFTHGLYLARQSQDEALNRIIVVEALGHRGLPERQRAETPAEKLERLEATLKRHGRLGQLILDEAMGRRR